MRVKGISPLFSWILYVGISLSAVLIVTNVLLPHFEGIREKGAFETGKEIMQKFSYLVGEVVEEGEGSARVFQIRIPEGKFYINPETEQAVYEIETTQEFVSPGTKKTLGKVAITSMSDVGVADNGDVITLRNSYLEVNFTKRGNESAWEFLNLSEIIEGIKLLKENEEFSGSTEILIENNTLTGDGYVYAEEYGSNLPRGRIFVKINATPGLFTFRFTLNSYADYLVVECVNYTLWW